MRLENAITQLPASGLKPPLTGSQPTQLTQPHTSPGSSLWKIQPNFVLLTSIGKKPQNTYYSPLSIPTNFHTPSAANYVSYPRYSIRTSAPQRSFFSFGGAIKLLLLVGAICVAGWLLFQQTVRNKLGDAVQAKIQEQLSPLGLGLQIGDTRFTEGKGLTLDDVDLYLAGPEYNDSTASLNSSGSFNSPGSFNSQASSKLRVGQLHVHSRSTLTELAIGALKPDSIEIRRAKLQVVRGLDGQFDLAPLVTQLSQLSTAGETQVVPVMLRDSEIEIVSLDPETPTITLSGINFAISQVDFQGQPLLHIQGEFNTRAVSQIGISLFVNQQTKTWNAQLSCEKATISRDIVKMLPPNVASQFSQTQNINGELSFNMTASGNDRFDQLPTFEIKGRLDNFGIDDPRLPMAIAGLSTPFLVNNNGIVVQNLQGAIDHTTGLNLTYTQVGLFQRKAWRCVGTVNQFVLNSRPRLTAWLTASGHKFMRIFSPSGTGNIAFDVSHDGRSLSKKITGDITDLSFAFEKMPYQVDHCTGKIELIGTHCDFSIQSTIHNQPVSITGYADNIGIGSTPSYRLNLKVPSNIPIDEKLLTSIKAQPVLSKVVQAFNPSGFLNGSCIIERATPESPINKWFDIRLNECSIKHKNFPYPIHHVSGQVLVNNLNFEFRNLLGRNNNGLVQCNGLWAEASGLDLKFQCRNVPLDDQLRQALQPEIREIWDGFRPRGAIEHLNVFLRLPSGAKEVDLQVEATFPESDAAAANYVSIFPIWFPYQINHLTGKLNVGQGRISLQDASGRHHKTRFACEGQGRYTNTDWSIRLKNLLVTALPVDADLLAAVPESLATPLAQLRFEGLANLNGEITLAGAKIHNEFAPTPSVPPAQRNQAQFAKQFAPGGRAQQASHSTPAYNPPESSMAWDVRINTNQANMLVGLPLKNVFGGVRLTGIYDGANIDCDGHLDLDSMTVYDHQVTKITGPFKIDNQRVTAGKFVEKSSQAPGVIASLQTIDSAPAESISGILYKGVVRLDAQMNTFGKNDFFVQSTLADGCIATACQDFAPDLKNVTGHSFAKFQMTGDSTGTHSHRGKGVVELRDAKIYELPVFISLLKLVNVRQLTRTAFDSGNIDFKLLGERIVFERMEFIGDAISLLGDGEMNLDWDIDLNFYSVIGRNRLNIPLISKLYREGSQRTLAIKVNGKLDNPKTHSTVLPEFNENVRQLFNSESSIANRFTTPTNQPSTQGRATRVGQNFFQQVDQLPVRIDTLLQR